MIPLSTDQVFAQIMVWDSAFWPRSTGRWYLSITNFFGHGDPKTRYIQLGLLLLWVYIQFLIILHLFDWNRRQTVSTTVAECHARVSVISRLWRSDRNGLDFISSGFLLQSSNFDSDGQNVKSEISIKWFFNLPKVQQMTFDDADVGCLKSGVPVAAVDGGWVLWDVQACREGLQHDPGAGWLAEHWPKRTDWNQQFSCWFTQDQCNR